MQLCADSLLYGDHVVKSGVLCRTRPDPASGWSNFRGLIDAHRAAESFYLSGLAELLEQELPWILGKGPLGTLNVDIVVSDASTRAAWRERLLASPIYSASDVRAGRFIRDSHILLLWQPSGTVTIDMLRDMGKKAKQLIVVPKPGLSEKHYRFGLGQELRLHSPSGRGETVRL